MPDAATTAHTEVPAGNPEDFGYSLAALDLGGNVVMLGTAVGVLWWWGKGLVERLISVSASTTEALHKVEVAVTRSDANNTAAIGALAEAINRHDARLERHDTRLDQHHDRLSHLEYASGQSGVRRPPKAARD